MILSRTPYRVSLFGGGSDYPEWFLAHGGAVLAATIARYCHVSARWLPPFFAHRSRIVWSKIELVTDHAEIEYPAVRAALAMLGIEEGVELHHDGDLPARSGIGSSSAFVVGLLHAFHALRGELVSSERLAHEAIRLELDMLHEPVGEQDQILCAMGGLRLITWESSGAWRADPVPLAPDILRAFEDRLLLIYAGARAGSVILPQGHNRTVLAQIQEMPSWGAKHLADADWQALGELLEAAWWAKRELAPGIVTPEIDDLYGRLRAAGAAAVRLLGAGGGGFMLAYADPDRMGAVFRVCQRLVTLPVRFESRGSTLVYVEGEARP